MIAILMKGHSFQFELENLCQLFYPNEKIKAFDSPPEDAGIIVDTCLSGADIRVSVALSGEIHEEKGSFIPSNNPERQAELLMSRLLFSIFVKLTGFTPSWGIATGIRPIKLLNRIREEEGGEHEAVEYFKREFLVSDEKTALALRTSGYEKAILDSSRPRSYSLYISIPFCPSRCSYCSFVSESVEKSFGIIDRYLELLLIELKTISDIVKDYNLTLETVYIGGGTPTILSASRLELLMKAVKELFDLGTLREYTVEAGRPDTVTAEKMRVLKKWGATRVSINPQTFNDAVLEKVGRRHTTAETLEAYEIARKCSAGMINMDLIAGLPGDTVESFENTVKRIVELSPENVTVHTLALKRSSALMSEVLTEFRAHDGHAEDMLRIADTYLTDAGYHPYYLYRQSRTLGNLENVGWAKDGCDGYYNVYILDETHSILAAGAGAVTKLRQPGSYNIERVFNYKIPLEYVKGFDEMIKRKETVRRFYETYYKQL